MNKNYFDGKSILITGGTGSFGKFFTRYLFENYNPARVIIFSRDEFKQFKMREDFMEYDSRLRYFIGDVREKERLLRAFDGVQIVVHAAAMKQVPTCEYNPIEAIKTNINGAMNVIDAAIDRKVQQVVALSTDKAVNPVNLYGGTKFVSDKLFVSANAYTKISGTRFSVVRYGNVAGSRGSVIPFFKRLVAEGATELPVTDARMTRFWIDLKRGSELVIKSLENAQGGEVYVAKLPSFKITDLVEALLPGSAPKNIGIREGEKLHEVMITNQDVPYTLEFDDYYAILPNFSWWHMDESSYADGKRPSDDFEYSSGNNTQWLSVEELRAIQETIPLLKD